jgi:protein-L-isoaspartate(D-aspartate) O-methyltransferase
MLAVPRHRFVPPALLDSAYDNEPLPIGYGQTISQPAVVALMTEALELSGTDRVLEIGTGSGYQAAILSLLAREVFSIEIVEPLGAHARYLLKVLGYDNIAVRIGDGHQGWGEHAPFDRIVLTAAPQGLPPSLVNQTSDHGVLVAPIDEPGEFFSQRLMRWRKSRGRLLAEDLGPVRFVPMIRP